MLISPELWKLQRSRHLTTLRLPACPEDYISGLVAAANAGIERVTEALARGDLTVSESELHLPALTAEALPAGARRGDRQSQSTVGGIHRADSALPILAGREVGLLVHGECGNVTPFLEGEIGSETRNALNRDVHARP